MVNVPELFGSNVFNDDVMRDKLPKPIYKALKKTIQDGETLDDMGWSAGLHPSAPCYAVKVPVFSFEKAEPS